MPSPSGLAGASARPCSSPVRVPTRLTPSLPSQNASPRSPGHQRGEWTGLLLGVQALFLEGSSEAAALPRGVAQPWRGPCRPGPRYPPRACLLRAPFPGDPARGLLCPPWPEPHRATGASVTGDRTEHGRRTGPWLSPSPLGLGSLDKSQTLTEPPTWGLWGPAGPCGGWGDRREPPRGARAGGTRAVWGVWGPQPAFLCLLGTPSHPCA